MYANKWELLTMATCNHGNPTNSAPDEVIDNLPDCQAGEGRHKCAVCAYNEGLAVAKGKQYQGVLDSCSHKISAPKAMLTALPENQGGIHRHKCTYTAYQRGLEAGLHNNAVEEFENNTDSIDTTEAIALQKIRIGQQIFRRELLKFWNNECALTGISDTSLIIASHIKPWSKCIDNNERLDVYNGVLLSSLHDAAFDRGLLSFEDNGQPIYSNQLSQTAQKLLADSSIKNISFSTKHYPYLDWHRSNLFHH